MSHTAKVTLGAKKGNTLVVVCGVCSRETVHEVIADAFSEDEIHGGDIWWKDAYFIIECRGCKTLSFCKESVCSEDYAPDGDDLLVKRELFPGRIAGRPPLSDTYLLPWDIQRIYEESRSALMQNLPVLTGIGIRAIVETVCKDKGAQGNDLYHKINSLTALNFITETEAAVLHDLRFMGNEAAHKVKAHTQEELNLAFTVVEHLLNTVYLLAEQAKRLPKASTTDAGSDVGA